MRIGVKCGQWGWSFSELEEGWRAAERCGFALLSCFDRITSAPQGLRAWDAVALLVAMAKSTESIRLSVHMLNATLRHPALLASQLAVAQAASRGRIEVGLGAGAKHWAPFDNRPLGIPFPSHATRIVRLEALCRTLPALWRGETVTDEVLGLREVSFGPLEIEPPSLTLGGRSDGILELAARYADGWDAIDSEPTGFERLARRLDDLCRAVGRVRPIEKAVQIWVSELRDTDPRTLLRQYEEMGCTTAVFVLHRERGPDAVRRFADAAL
jgi:alkanesulfonate monooxygenase SsuD/methylene tetrahydromethanopterin reductase-like flavin-dependent oxidoreductase (luciferase family)